MRGKPGYEHLNEPLHILIEAEAAEVPASIVDVRLKQAKDIIEELLKPVVSCDAHSFQPLFHPLRLGNAGIRLRIKKNCLLILLLSVGQK